MTCRFRDDAGSQALAESAQASLSMIETLSRVALDWRHRMFEPWRKFNAKKATTLMNNHNKTLRREHAQLKRLLRQKSKQQTPADISERINALRQTRRKIVIDHTLVCHALIAECCRINFMKILDLFVAHSFLGVTCDKVWQTLESSACRQAN